jgi:hypothetical protein
MLPFFPAKIYFGFPATVRRSLMSRRDTRQ